MKDAVTEVRLATWERDRDAISAVRNAVFAREQGIPQELDFDGTDPTCWHVLAFEPGGQAIGTGRLQKDGRIGRVAVLKDWRRHGVGRALMEGLIRIAAAEGLSEVYLHSQAHAVRFYEKLGFRTEGDAFLEAGIEHYTMIKRFEAAGQPEDDRRDGCTHGQHTKGG
jgi:predicted GNAT family N-acyltransferase